MLNMTHVTGRVWITLDNVIDSVMVDPFAQIISTTELSLHLHQRNRLASAVLHVE